MDLAGQQERGLEGVLLLVGLAVFPVVALFVFFLVFFLLVVIVRGDGGGVGRAILLGEERRREGAQRERVAKTTNALETLIGTRSEK